MFYLFDPDRWIIHQLPPALRRSVIYSFLRALLYPLKELVLAFTTYRDAVLLQLGYNGFLNYLERWLNGLFFYQYYEIYITEEELPIPSLSYDYEDLDPVYMTAVDEDPSVALELYSFSPNNKICVFVVHVPPMLSESDIALVEKWVNYYKFAGTQYRVEQY